MNIFASLIIFLSTLTVYHVFQFKFFLPDYELKKLENFFNKKIDELNIANKLVDDEITEYMYNIKKIIQFKHYFKDIDVIDLIQNMKGANFVKNLMKRIKHFQEEDKFLINNTGYNLCIFLPLFIPILKLIINGIKHIRQRTKDKVKKNNLINNTGYNLCIFLPLFIPILKPIINGIKYIKQRAKDKFKKNNN